MKATFENSVDVLVKAYLNDTLEHVSCSACAVGNLIADANNYKFERINNSLSWSNNSRDWFLVINPCHHGDRMEAMRQINSIGYTEAQVRDIEHAFEHPEKRSNDKMFNGLLAVVDVLADIHKVDLSVKESAVSRFVEVKTAK